MPRLHFPFTNISRAYPRSRQPGSLSRSSLLAMELDLYASVSDFDDDASVIPPSNPPSLSPSPPGVPATRRRGRPRQVGSLSDHSLRSRQNTSPAPSRGSTRLLASSRRRSPRGETSWTISKIRSELSRRRVQFSRTMRKVDLFRLLQESNDSQEELGEARALASRSRSVPQRAARSSATARGSAFPEPASPGSSVVVRRRHLTSPQGHTTPLQHRQTSLRHRAVGERSEPPPRLATASLRAEPPPRVATSSLRVRVEPPPHVATASLLAEPPPRVATASLRVFAEPPPHVATASLRAEPPPQVASSAYPYPPFPGAAPPLYPSAYPPLSHLPGLSTEPAPQVATASLHFPYPPPPPSSNRFEPLSNRSTLTPPSPEPCLHPFPARFLAHFSPPRTSLSLLAFSKLFPPLSPAQAA